jgi:hypothetical protein
MNEQSLQTEKTAGQEVFQVKQFLKSLYFEHRLHTAEIQNFRDSVVVQGIEAWAKEAGLSDKDYFAIPIGSTRTLPNDISDIDFIVVLNTENEPPEEFDDYYQLNMLPSRLSVNGRKVEKIASHKSSQLRIEKQMFKELIANGQARVSTAVDGNLISELMLTPDSLIVGNVSLAQQVRVEALAFIDEVCDVERFWDSTDSVVQTKLSEHIVGWPKRTDGNKTPENAREGRFHSAVEKIVTQINEKYGRSNLDHDSPGRKWAIAFQEHLTKIRVPNFQTYKTALLETGGALEI